MLVSIPWLRSSPHSGCAWRFSRLEKVELAGALHDLPMPEGHTQMYKPPHPGEVLKGTVLRPDGGITLTEFAQRLRVSHIALSRVVSGKAAVSAELAIRLAAALRDSAESWLRMQLAHDLWHAQRKRRPKIEPLEMQRNSKGAGTLAEFFAKSPLRESGLKAK